MNKAYKTPLEELRKEALKHYDEISLKAHHYLSTIPIAINYYFDNHPHLLREDGEKQERKQHLVDLLNMDSCEEPKHSHREYLLTRSLLRDKENELTAAKAEIEKLERDNKAHASTNAQLSEHINYLNKKIQELENYPCTCSSDIERLGCKEMCDFNKSLKTKT